MDAMNTNIIKTTARRTICSKARIPRRTFFGRRKLYTPLAFGLLAAMFMLLTSCSGGCEDFAVSAMGECGVAYQSFGTTAAKVTDVTISQIFPERRNHTSVVFDNKLWVIGGLPGRNTTVPPYSDVWFSADGKNWIEKTSDGKFTGRYGHASVVFKDRMWIIGGSASGDSPTAANTRLTRNDVWSSSDGQNWTQTQTTAGAVFSARFLHSAVVFDNKLWVIGGSAEDSNGLLNPASDVWSSPDGATWTLVSTGKFSPRQSHSSAVFDGKLWVVGGSNSIAEDLLNDVWSSTDGVNWTEETAAAAFSPRISFGLVTFARSLWVVGGRGGRIAPTYGDIWVLRDDGIWVQSPATIPQRSDGTVMPFNQKLFILGGTDGGVGTYSDVWSFQ